jgi:hypothetical protein
MEIQPSIESQALYGDKGRVAIPLNVFMKQSKAGQIGGKKDIEHLGVPLVIALVNVNMNKPCVQHSYIDDDPLDQIVEYVPNESVERSSSEFEPISDEVYDTLFNTVLDEPISEESPAKKYTRKNRKELLQ